MFCRFCGQNMEDTDVLCPACGAAQTEPAPAKKKLKVWQIVLIVLGAVALLAVLTWSVLTGLGIDLKDVFWPENTIHCKEAYVVEDDVAVKKQNVVVAQVGDKTLTNSELQVYYWMTAWGFINDYYYYLTYMGLDYTRPFSEQTCYYDSALTWEQYFLQNAIEVWHRYTTLTLRAEELNLEMDADAKADYDGKYLELTTTAVSNGYASAEELLKTELGPAVTMEGYMAYWYEYWMGLTYFNSIYDSLVPTSEEIADYISKNSDILKAYGVTWGNERTVDVRHILLVPESAKSNGSANGVTCPDSEWEACYAEAEALLEQWRAGEATAESFGQLANTYSLDPGSNTKGGLYEGVNAGDMVAEFDAWIQDEANGIGASGIVKTVHGYHIMYLEDATEFVWDDSQVAKYMLEERVLDMVQDGMDHWPVSVKYNKIVLGQVDLVLQ